MDEVKKLENKIANEMELVEYNGRDKVVSSFDAKKYFKDRAAPQYRLMSGFNGLDWMTDGFYNGALIAVSGLTKSGKTTLCQSITQNFAKQKINSIWFSYEVPGLQFIEKFPILPLFYMPIQNTESGLGWIEKRVIESKMKFNVKAVFLDHLHYLIPMTAQGNISIMIGGVMRELKKMALRHNIVIFLIAHTKKTMFEARPTLEDIRDSSFIAQESDFVMTVWRKVEKEGEETIYTNEAKLFLLANRWNGKNGSVNLTHTNGMFCETEENQGLLQ